MKKYESQLQEYFKNVLTYKNHTVYDIEHSLARFKERLPLLEAPVYFNLLKKGIDYLILSKLEKVEDRYIFISEKYDFGIQVHWREDRYKPIFNAYTATTFSNEEMNFFTKADKEVFLENVNKKLKNKLVMLEFINRPYYRYRFKKELKEETELINMDMFIEYGKIYYTYKFIKL
jgi:hypothetical protein